MTLEHYEHVKSPVASPVLLLFWPTLLAVDMFQLRSWWLQGVHDDAPIHFWLLVLRIVCIIVVYVVEVLPKPASVYQPLDEEMVSKQVWILSILKKEPIFIQFYHSIGYHHY
jgi:hypothetical protein